MSSCGITGNMTGRLGWAAASDYLGRKSTYALFGLGIPICLAVPTLTATVASNPSVVPLVRSHGSSAGRKVCSLSSASCNKPFNYLRALVCCFCARVEPGCVLRWRRDRGTCSLRAG
jgi:hypothetical protein